MYFYGFFRHFFLWEFWLNLLIFSSKLKDFCTFSLKIWHSLLKFVAFCLKKFWFYAKPKLSCFFNPYTHSLFLSPLLPNPLSLYNEIITPITSLKPPKFTPTTLLSPTQQTMSLSEKMVFEQVLVCFLVGAQLWRNYCASVQRILLFLRFLCFGGVRQGAGQVRLFVSCTG